MSSATSYLLLEARRLLAYGDNTTAGLWPRAAALLARQALEQAVDDFWRRRAPGVENCSGRAQFLCLRSYVDKRVAEEADHTWGALSRACHQHAYELAPTASELDRWMHNVDSIIGSLETAEY